MRRAFLAFTLVAGLIAGTSSAIAARTRFIQLPPLPDSIPSQLGWVIVHKVGNLQCNGTPALGCFEYLSRTLSVRDSMNLAVAWQTLRHEQVHMVLFDAGIQIRSTGLEDQIGDAIGAARVTEMQYH